MQCDGTYNRHLEKWMALNRTVCSSVPVQKHKTAQKMYTKRDVHQCGNTISWCQQTVLKHYIGWHAHYLMQCNLRSTAHDIVCLIWDIEHTFINNSSSEHGKTSLLSPLPSQWRRLCSALAGHCMLPVLCNLHGTAHDIVHLIWDIEHSCRYDHICGSASLFPSGHQEPLFSDCFPLRIVIIFDLYALYPLSKTVDAQWGFEPPYPLFSDVLRCANSSDTSPLISVLTPRMG